MLPKFYLNHLQNRLKQAQIVTLEILVWLLQVHKDVRIEKLASHYPLPIKQESRRRHLQRFLSLPTLSIPLIWFPLIKQIIQENCPQRKPLYLALDRTQWKDKNLFMVAVIYQKRALPEVRFPMRDTIALGSHLFIGSFYQKREPVISKNKKQS